MSLAHDIVSIPQSQHQRHQLRAPAPPLRKAPVSVVPLSLVRGPAAELRARENRGRAPQKAVGFTLKEATPSRFKDDRGALVAIHQNDPLNVRQPEGEDADLYHYVEDANGKSQWRHKITNKPWRIKRIQAKDNQPSGGDAGYNLQREAKRAEREQRAAVSLSSGIGEILDFWRVDFSDVEVHPELRIVPMYRQCKAINESSSYCCSERAIEGQAYCASHQLAYHRKDKPKALKLGGLR